jgi:hypothetical protein
VLADRRARWLLLAVVGPLVLFGFALLFGAHSYQFWGDRYHYNLTNRYLFARIGGVSPVEPLWRDDILGGNVWIVSVVTTPVALPVLVSRVFALTPVAIDLVSGLIAYAAAAGAMYLFLRRALVARRETAAAFAAAYAATGYYLSMLLGTADLPTTTALAPALLALVHRLARSLDRRSPGGTSPADVGLSLVSLVLLVFLTVIHSTLAVVPMVAAVVLAYAVVALGGWRLTALVAAAFVAGAGLASPFLWLFWQAAQISQRSLPGFFPVPSFAPGALAEQFLVLAKRVAVGHNAYGLWTGVVLVVLTAVARRRGGGPSGAAGRVVAFMAGAAAVCFAIEAFAPQINHLARRMPVLRGYDVAKIYIFLPLFTLATAAWLWDRYVDSPAVAGRSRPVLVVGGLVLLAQLVHWAARLRGVAHDVSPQDVLLYALATGYFLATVGLLWLLAAAPGPARRRWAAPALALSAVLAAAAAGYRPGVDALTREAGDEPIMTYTERYAAPADIARAREIARPGDRVVDLTRTYTRVLSTSDMAALPLAGLRTLSGYNTLYPVWYHRLITRGINGVESPPGRWLQVVAGERANLEALGLLGVRHVIAPAGAAIAGYRPVAGSERRGRQIYEAEDPGVAEAFLSTGLRCLPDDDAALALIHGSRLAILRSTAVLTSSDPASARWCAQRPAQPRPGLAEAIAVSRGTDRVTVDLAAPAPGILTLAQTYYPGWRVLDNGVERPLLRTYTALQGVAVDAGRHRLEFVFAPTVFWRLLAASSAVLAVLAAATAWLWRRISLTRRRGDR